MGLFNIKMAVFGNPSPTDVDLICNKARLVIILFVSMHFFTAHFTNFMHDSICCFGDGKMRMPLA